jgi:hypothetical protein
MCDGEDVVTSIVAHHDRRTGECMARLIYGMIMSLDGYTEDARGAFGWGARDIVEAVGQMSAL